MAKSRRIRKSGKSKKQLKSRNSRKSRMRGGLFGNWGNKSDDLEQDLKDKAEEVAYELRQGEINSDKILGLTQSDFACSKETDKQSMCSVNKYYIYDTIRLAALSPSTKFTRQDKGYKNSILLSSEGKLKGKNVPESESEVLEYVKAKLKPFRDTYKASLPRNSHNNIIESSD